MSHQQQSEQKQYLRNITSPNSPFQEVPYSSVNVSQASPYIEKLSRLMLELQNRQKQIPMFSNQKQSSNKQQSSQKQQKFYLQNQIQPQTSYEPPETLDILKTKSLREKNLTLRKVIQQTIQLLLQFYSKKSSSKMSNEEINQGQNQIFQRLTYIFSEMNELSQQIQNTILYLNREGMRQKNQQQKLNSKLNKNQIKAYISERQQVDEQSQNNDEEEYKQNQQPMSQNQNGNASLEERFYQHQSQLSMEIQSQEHSKPDQ